MIYCFLSAETSKSFYLNTVTQDFQALDEKSYYYHTQKKILKLQKSFERNWRLFQKSAVCINIKKQKKKAIGRFYLKK